MLSFRFVSILCALLLVSVVALLPGDVLADPRNWGSDGVYIRQGHHIDWSRASYRNNDGYTLIVWSDTRAGDRDLYGQLVHPNGSQMWESTGKQLARTRAFRQEDPEVVAVNGGWIVVWNDFREDTLGNPYAQKYNMSGDPLWPANDYTGVRLDSFPSKVQEYSLRAVHDGQGGAIVAWEDWRRDGVGDILAQRVDANGSIWPQGVLWVTDADNGQTGITADSDGQGNMLVAWKDDRDNPATSDVYAAKITADRQLPWGNLIVSTAADEQTGPKLCPDGSGGCYVTWVDKRTGEEDIYAQRISSSGQVQWAANGIAVCASNGKQEGVRIASSMNGATQDGALLIWEDLRLNGQYYEVYSQKISASGATQWIANGLKVCGDGITHRKGGRLTTDLAGGMLCAWEDLRDAENLDSQADLYMTRILANGTHGCGECGVTVADSAGVRLSGPQSAPLLRADDGDGVFIFYSDKRAGSTSLRYQNHSIANCARTLALDGVEIVYGLDGNATRPRSIPMDMGRVGVVWEDTRSNSLQVFYQVIDRDGQVDRVQNGSLLAPDNTGGSQFQQEKPEICPDGASGFFTCFVDTRGGTKLVRVAHVDSQGELVSPDSGVTVWTPAGVRDQGPAFLTPDGQGGIYVAWSGYASNFWIDVYVMRMNASLQPMWAQPIRLQQTYNDDILRGIVTNPDGCCILVWQSGELFDFNVSAARICGDSTIWNFDVCNAEGDQSNPTIVADRMGGAYIAWGDARPGTQDVDVWAQHVNANGAISWNANGIAVVTAPDDQSQPVLEVDGSGNMFVVWQDFRSGSHTDIYAQKMSPSGQRLWAETGRSICTVEGQQNEQVAAVEWDNGLYTVWTDGRGYHSDIYGAHLTAAGNLADAYWRPDSGGVVMDFFHIQDAPTLASDGAGAVIATWQDYRASGKEPLVNLYSQWLNDFTVSVREIPNAGVPQRHELSQNYPNPFNPTTHIRFSIPQREHVEIKVFNMLGQETATLISGIMNAGAYVLEFEAHGLPSGTYFYRLNTPSFQTVRKMVLLR